MYIERTEVGETIVIIFIWFQIELCGLSILEDQLYSHGFLLFIWIICEYDILKDTTDIHIVAGGYQLAFVYLSLILFLFELGCDVGFAFLGWGEEALVLGCDVAVV